MQQRRCADCAAELVPIRVVVNVKDAGWSVEMAHVEANARHAWLTHQYDAMGPVEAMACPECGLIRLYAQGPIPPKGFRY